MQKVTIAVTRYDEPNWLVREALESLARQDDVTAEVLFLDQRHDPDFWRDVERLTCDHVRFVASPIAARSLSFARNHAISAAACDLVLYMDCDAVADPRWAAELAGALRQEGVGIVGSRIVPRWSRPPLLIARAWIAWEQYALLDFGPGIREVSKVVGAGFGIDRRALADQAYFREDLGRREGRLHCGEDTDICNRAVEKGLSVLYNGDSMVEHQIQPERIRYRWILKRLFYAGANRAVLGGPPGATHALSTWDYLFLPAMALPYAAGFAHAIVTRGRAPAARAAPANRSQRH